MRSGEFCCIHCLVLIKIVDTPKNFTNYHKYLSWMFFVLSWSFFRSSWNFPRPHFNGDPTFITTLNMHFHCCSFASFQLLALTSPFCLIYFLWNKTDKTNPSLNTFKTIPSLHFFCLVWIVWVFPFSHLIEPKAPQFFVFMSGVIFQSCNALAVFQMLRRFSILSYFKKYENWIIIIYHTVFTFL